MTEPGIAQAGRDQALQGLLAHAAADAGLRARLLQDCAGALRENGIAMPDGAALRPVDAAPGTCYLVLPAAPVEREVSDEDLELVGGGATPVSVAAAVTLATITGWVTNRWRERYERYQQRALD